MTEATSRQLGRAAYWGIAAVSDAISAVPRPPEQTALRAPDLFPR